MTKERKSFRRRKLWLHHQRSGKEKKNLAEEFQEFQLSWFYCIKLIFVLFQLQYSTKRLL